MKFNRLCFFSVVCLCGISLLSQSVFAGKYKSDFSPCKKVTLQKQGGNGGTDYLYVSRLRVFSGVYADSGSCSDANSPVTSITIPAREGYVFKGYYSLQTGGDLLIIQTGVITDKMVSSSLLSSIYAQWEKCEGTVENNICIKTCSTGLKYGEDDHCVNADEYLNNGTWTTCPTPKQSDTRYSFIKEEDSSYNIETCAIKLTNTSCGSRTKVIYRYSVDDNAYVRSDDYFVIASSKSLIKSEINTDYPTDTIYLNDDMDDTHNSQSEDYCDQCGTGIYANNGPYNINGKCGYCHSGYCIDGATDSCEICPAGFACPGNGDITSIGSLYCTYKTACGPDEYAQSGQTRCSKCGAGYSTYTSGPAVRISEDVVFDGTCKSRDGDDVSAFGIMCTSVDACKSIPVQLCFKPDCHCTKEEYSDDGNYIEQRTSCGSSYGLGDNKVWGAVNTKVVQTQRKDKSE